MTDAEQFEETAVGPASPTEEPEPEQHDCRVCHGEGYLSCINGCHDEDCDECDGSGRLWADDSPVPANEVRY